MKVSMTRVLSQQTPSIFTSSVVAASQWPDALADAQVHPVLRCQLCRQIPVWPDCLGLLDLHLTVRSQARPRCRGDVLWLGVDASTAHAVEADFHCNSLSICAWFRQGVRPASSSAGFMKASEGQSMLIIIYIELCLMYISAKPRGCSYAEERTFCVGLACGSASRPYDLFRRRCYP
jgi:hypothetical protein